MGVCGIDSWIPGICFHVVSLCDFADDVVGYEHAIAMHLTLWYIMLVCHQNDVCENYIGSLICWWLLWSERNCKSCPVGFLVVCKCRLCCNL